jgi:hypothetical protein
VRLADERIHCYLHLFSFFWFIVFEDLLSCSFMACVPTTVLIPSVPEAAKPGRALATKAWQDVSLSQVDVGRRNPGLRLSESWSRAGPGPPPTGRHADLSRWQARRPQSRAAGSGCRRCHSEPERPKDPGGGRGPAEPGPGPTGPGVCRGAEAAGHYD